jgi:serine/threonine protein kinase
LLRAGINGEDDESDDLTADSFDGCEDFGVYQIDRREDGSLYELGQGAMGITYRATDTALQRKVALKIIRIEVADRSKEAGQNFLREARAAAALRHENIATVFQFGIHEETGQCFYAMELIEGETLEERVRRAGPLDPRTTIDIAQQVTAALATVEKRALIHRDLKPANLMLVDSNGPEVMQCDRRVGWERTARRAVPIVKIIDFGLAKAVHAPGDPVGLTHDCFIGTRTFASPEQFENSTLDVRSDIYSLGVTLWFALTGKTPFAGSSCEEIHRAQQFNALPIEQLKSAGVPSRLRLLLKSMLAFERAERPGTQELAAELRRCAAQATGMRRHCAVLAATAMLVPIASALFFHSLRTYSAPPASGLNPALPQKSIGMLPFENLSYEQHSAFLARQAYDDVLTKVAEIVDLKVGRIATTPAAFVEIDKRVTPTIEQYRTAAKTVKVRHRPKQVVRVRTLWDKLLYGWVAERRHFVKKKMRSSVDATMGFGKRGQVRTSAQIPERR